MVRRSREWYAANKDKVQQNPDYSPSDNFVNRDGVSVNVGDGVFVPQADLTARRVISIVVPLLVAIALIYTGYEIWRNPRANAGPRTREAVPTVSAAHRACHNMTDGLFNVRWRMDRI